MDKDECVFGKKAVLVIRLTRCLNKRSLKMTPTVSGGRQSGVLEGEAEGVSGSGEGFWTNDV